MNIKVTYLQKKIGYKNGPVGGEMTKMMVKDFEERLANKK